MSEGFYITTAIDYSNGEPHIGHAFEKIGADCIARYHRLRGDHVHFLIGMDEHGKKVAQEAAARGVDPQALVDVIAAKFQDAWRTLTISYDQFIRTTQAEHKAGVTALIERIFRSRPNDLYEKAYEGWYCVGCEQFKRDSEIENGHCLIHPTRELEWSQERNWFFRLSGYQDFVRRLFDEQPRFLQPTPRRNEILALLDQGLEDISVTRAGLTWAIPFPRPLSTGERQGTWVWFDALPNYLTATGFPDSTYARRWPAQLHVIGKDITRLHCVIWPAMLQAAQLPLPRAVWAHGFVNFSGKRFSKSAGVRLELADAVQRHGPDALRYFLLSEVPWDGDGDFGWDRFDARYEAELANGYGNLASRVLAMTARYLDGAVPDGGGETPLDGEGQAVIAAYRDAMDAHLLHEGARHIRQLVSRANAFVEETAPWKLAKEDNHDALRSTLGALVRAVARITLLVSPFMPTKTRDVWAALGASSGPEGASWSAVLDPPLRGNTVTQLTPLFPKNA
jgi:methionyl-tRNA synthetase